MLNMFFTIRSFILTAIVFTPRPYCWRRANRSDNVFVAASIDAVLTIWHLPYCIQHCTNKNNDSQLNVIFKNWTIAGVQFVWTSSLKGLCLLPQSYRLWRSFTSEGLCKDATIRSSIHTFLRMWLIIIYNSMTTPTPTTPTQGAHMATRGTSSLLKLKGFPLSFCVRRTLVSMPVTTIWRQRNFRNKIKNPIKCNACRLNSLFLKSLHTGSGMSSKMWVWLWNMNIINSLSPWGIRDAGS